ncbi:type III secretion system outer membrane ring subunit SctC [Aquincola sp. S2]|uniref:Type 3 secretion system secretin n=1 Tax=Pseudaquabacterium terrae TaxID=2732868 RepID=A0ABX2EV63_9BURK|nr:type III secretion system outer membrane ring subunit SctC [Aquabacterium terrae]NRF72434.1 type III secretion system outer membrane ring subunit SctC [Aquabacterium terrae]
MTSHSISNPLHSAAFRSALVALVLTAFGAAAHGGPASFREAQDTPPSSAPAGRASIVKRAPAAETAALLPTEPSRGNEQVWATARFTYRADGKRLGEVLQDFASSQGLPAIIGEGVDGVVHATFDSTPQAFLNAIGKAYGVVWYHDGTTLYFYPSKAMTSRLFRLKGFTRAQVQDVLTTLRLGDSRYPLRFNERENTLLVYGPPRHLDVVSAAIESLDAGASESNRRSVRVFQLRYASAADRQLGETFMPGVASMLRSLYGSGASQGGESQGAGRPGAAGLSHKMQTMRNTYGSAKLAPEMDQRATDPVSGSTPERSSTGVAPRGVRSPVNFEEDTPTFEADEGTNSVIVNGRLHRMAEYDYLIRRLDMRPTMVELEAMIIDVSSDSLDKLGISWSAMSGGGKSLSITSPGGTLSASQVAVPGSFAISALWTNAGRQLLANIEALASSGQARIVAKPKVVGVANRPAVMQEKRRAAVRVAANLDAKLYTVEAGTLLQVTPQVTSLTGTPQIKLSVYIEDGNFETQAVDSIPVVKRTEIRTEAHVVEGESLLIGGISIEGQSSQINGVPGLSKLPGIGALFRWEGTRGTRSERLFLITPKIVRNIDELPTLPTNEADPAETPAMPEQDSGRRGSGGAVRPALPAPSSPDEHLRGAAGHPN